MWRYAVALLYCAGLSGCNSCNPAGPTQSHSGGRSQQPVGELTIGAWQPFGLSETDPQLMDAAELEDLKFNLIQFNPRQKFAAAVVDVNVCVASFTCTVELIVSPELGRRGVT